MEDNWLSKNIRPMIIIYLLILFTWAFLDSMYGGNQREISDRLLDILEYMLSLAFCFYFGARGLEKIISMITGRKA